MNYKLLKDKETGSVYGAICSNGWSFVFEPANTDYQAYLKWLDAGNTPEAADAAPAQEGNGA
jgi:hypothetical protein